MTVQEIEYKLKQMRLPRMREEYKRQRNDPDFQHMSFDERFGQMVSLEYDARINSTIETLIRKAEFYDSTANLADVNYKPERKLDQGLIEELGTNEYIRSHLNIILIGASGCGKTWLSCAFGINACQARIKTKYIRLPELFSEFEAKKIQGQFRQYLKQLQKYDLLILDEFLLVAASPTERNDLLELMESRTNRRSTIFCSQWTPEGWHERLGAGPVADAILDRIVNSSYTIQLQGNSMREEYSKLKK
ncbi:MAG: IS21-like element helper ATPase IstB [Solobacterium sp.]|nr:IS21-like element helper ATPase IstB [Solobacterium sp.]